MVRRTQLTHQTKARARARLRYNLRLGHRLSPVKIHLLNLLHQHLRQRLRQTEVESNGVPLRTVTDQRQKVTYTVAEPAHRMTAGGMDQNVTKHSRRQLRRPLRGLSH